MVILNTCHIREKAAEKVFSELGRLRALKQARGRRASRMIIAVAGCVAQAEGEEITAPRARRSTSCSGRRPTTGCRRWWPAPTARPAGRWSTPTSRPRASSTTCPANRRVAGRHRLPDRAGGLRQVLHLLRRALHPRRRVFAGRRRRSWPRRAAWSPQGAREITLLGQNVNAYHGDGPDGVGLGPGPADPRAGRDRRPATASATPPRHPRDMDDDLIAAHRDVPQLMPFLHLPVQSGSDRILAAMNRKHTADDYRRIVDRLRAARPDIALSSDFIVGFPGETDARFRGDAGAGARGRLRPGLLLQVHRRAPARRPPALADQVPEAVKDERLQALQAAAVGAAGRLQPRHASGACCRCCSTGRAASPASCSGRSPYLQAVHLDGAGPADRHRRSRCASPSGKLLQPGRHRHAGRCGGGGVTRDSSIPADAGPVERPDQPGQAAIQRLRSASTTTRCCRC